MSFRPELLPRIVQRLAALADETRLHLLLRLRDGQANVSQLTQHVGAAQASVSKHLAVLKQAGLVDCRRQGNQAVYSIRDESIFDICQTLCDGVRNCLEEEHRLLGIGGEIHRKHK